MARVPVVMWSRSVNILAIDTSSPTAVVALDLGGDRHVSPGQPVRAHSRNILPSVMELLAGSGMMLGDLDFIVFGQGPGSFTGLRIAVGVVQGLGFGLSIPVVPVSSLACIARVATEQTGHSQVIAALHARKTEVYLGLYETRDGVTQSHSPERVVDVANLAWQLNGQWAGAGDGWVLKDQLEKGFGTEAVAVLPELGITPGSLLDIGIGQIRAGRVVEASAARPEYLREEVATPAARTSPGS